VIGHNEGTFIYNTHDLFNKINEINGGWNMVGNNDPHKQPWWNSSYDKASDLK
jgi:hypothetical protein